MTKKEAVERTLTERLCERNGWEYGSGDYDIAVSDVKWFLSQPELSVLFLKTPDNPDGRDEKLYEQFPVKKKSRPAPAISPYVPTERLTEKEPQPDESRLLTEIANSITGFGCGIRASWDGCGNCEGLKDGDICQGATELAKEILDKTARICNQECQQREEQFFDSIAQDWAESEAIAFETGKTEAQIECQQRVEGIKKKIEKALPFSVVKSNPMWWEDFWKKEGVG